MEHGSRCAPGVVVYVAAIPAAAPFEFNARIETETANSNAPTTVEADVSGGAVLVVTSPVGFALLARPRALSLPPGNGRAVGAGPGAALADG